MTEFTDHLRDVQNGKAAPIPTAGDGGFLQLTSRMGLAEVGLGVVSARIIGKGAYMSCDLDFSNGDRMTFPVFQDMMKPQKLRTALVCETGAAPKLKTEDCVQIVRLIRTLSDTAVATDLDGESREAGGEFLRRARTLEAKMSDQTDRWQTVTELEGVDPWSASRHKGGSIAAHSVVVRDTDTGSRYVRRSWFQHHYRQTVERLTPGDITHRMERVDWDPINAQGKVTATSPGGISERKQLRFYRVPERWESA